MSLNPILNKGYKDLDKFADSLFSLASDMDYFLKQAKNHNLNVDDFNTVYGLHSLGSDYKLAFGDTELAAVLFMIISGTPGDFKNKANFDPAAFARAIPHLAAMIKELQVHPEYINALNFFHDLRIPYGSDFSLNPKNRDRFDLLKVGQFLFSIAGFIDQRKSFNARIPGRGYYLEVIYKMYQNWDEIQQRLERVGRERITFVLRKNRIFL